MSDDSAPVGFDQLGLAAPVLEAIQQVGYEFPSPIQAEAIPQLLAGRSLLGQAQTGTGKTAAFALPLLSRLDLGNTEPQVLVLAPTRELAIQVAEAFQTYGRNLRGFHVLPVYGGQHMGIQLKQLRRGAQVIVGTPGRVMDHLRRGTLVLDALQAVVLDEADEMLRMGFIEAVEWILSQTPEERQVALFSATMPGPIRRVAETYLQDAHEVRIESRTSTVDTIDQRYWRVSGTHKLDALTRILEAEPCDGVIVFVRTKNATMELAERLEARGFASAALNGDMAQADRERTVDRLKSGSLDVVIATDVAARGLDVDRISHVINYDIPYDSEAYVHRIGRTGRAGRKGVAILFVAPREQRMLRVIERSTGSPIVPMVLPGREEIADRRTTRMRQRVIDVMEEEEDMDFFRELVEGFRRDMDTDLQTVAAAMACLLQQDRPVRAPEVRDEAPRREEHWQERPRREDRFQRDDRPARPKRFEERSHREREGGDRDVSAKPFEERSPREPKPDYERPPREDRRPQKEEGVDMVRYRVEVGRNDGVTPGDLVGAIANEAGVESRYIGRIDLFDDHSTVDLPDGMPKEIFEWLRKVRVRNRPLRIRALGPSYGDGRREDRDFRPRSSGGGFREERGERKSFRDRGGEQRRRPGPPNRDDRDRRNRSGPPPRGGKFRGKGPSH